MNQVFAIIISLIMIPLLLKRKRSVGCALVISSAVAGLTGGLTPVNIIHQFVAVFTEWSNLSAVLIVVEIGMLGALMSRCQLFEKAESSLKIVLPYPRMNMMLMPSVIGMLQVPGGAALSAPFCNHLGKEIGLTSAQRANTNVICRHIFMLCAPFSASVLMTIGCAPNLNVLWFLSLGFIFAMLMAVGNYIFFLRKSRAISLSAASKGEKLENLGIFFLVLSPIWIAVVLNAFLKLSYVATVPIAFGATILLNEKKLSFEDVKASYNLELTFMIVGVYFFQNIVRSMTYLQDMVTDLLAVCSSIDFLVIVALTALLFGLASGLMYTPLGVLAPIIATVYTDEKMLVIHMFYVFCWSYIGYLFSPLHMCQILSDRECGCTIGERYRAYIPMIIFLIVMSVAMYIVYSKIFF